MASSEQKRSWPRRLGALVIVFALIAAAVAAFTFALCPYGSRSQVVWSEFRATDKVDAVCLGSSIGAQSFDPAVVDEALGTNSFNMCTPSQTPAESYLGLKEALEHHKLNRVYYVVDFATFWNDYDMYPGRVFLNEKWKGDDFFQRFRDLSYALPDASWMLDEKSINWLFPWTEQRVWFSLLHDNVVMQLNGTPLIEAAEHNAQQENAPWTYYGKGYGNYDGFCDYNADSHLLYTNLGMRPLQDANLVNLVDICELCEENGVELVAFAPPRPDFGYIDMGERYNDYLQQMKAIVEEHGGSYYDFNLARPELFDSQEIYYRDWEHCNAIGASAFSESLAKLMAAKDAGEDIDRLFMTYDEKLASIDTISVVQLSEAPEGAGVKFTASCLAGANVKPEYQYLVAVDGDELQIIQDYSEANDFTFMPDEHGRYTVRVNVRQQGSDVEFEKHTQHQVVV